MIKFLYNYNKPVNLKEHTSSQSETQEVVWMLREFLY
jgi:hypothetical protein